MKKLLVFLFLLLASPAFGQYVRDNCSTFTVASSVKATCFDYTTHILYYWNGSSWTQASTGSSGAPSNATYITQTANGTLTAEQALGSLSSGILKSATTTGIVSIATPGTDYLTSTTIPPNPIPLGTQSLTVTLNNEGVTGTTAGLLVKVVNDPPVAKTIATTDTTSVFGVCVNISGSSNACGTTGSSDIAVLGRVSCQFDGATTANNFVVASTTSAGKCHDAGSTFPNAVAVLGTVLSTNGGAGTYSVNLQTPDVANSSNASGGGGRGTAITINGTAAKLNANFNASTPAVESGNAQITFQSSASGNTTSVSAEVPLNASTTQVLFNDGGTAIGGDSGLTYAKASDALTATGSVTTNKVINSIEVIVPVTETTMSGNATLSAGSSTTYQFFDPNGSDRDVTLPATATGMSYVIYNFGSANTLTVKANGGSTVTTVAFGTFKTVIYSGSAWRVF